MTSKPPPQTALKFERLFNATPEKLWSYWTEPLRYARWLNPAPDHDLVIHEWDLRVGGKVRFDMPQPDGNPNPQEGVFHVLDPFTELVSGSPDKSFLLRVTFEPVGKQTRMRVEVTGVPPQHHADATKGFNASFDKLTREVAVPSVFPVRRTYAPTLTIERTFKAPVEKVWAMWTTKRGLEMWYWPEGMVGKVNHLDLRIGGTWEIGAEGLPHTSRGTFTDILPGQRLGMVVPVDFLPDVEAYDRVDTVEFASVPGGSKVVLRTTRMHNDQWNALSSLGWTSSLNKLARALEGGGSGKAVGAIVGRSVRIERLFNAPPAKVWAAWSTAEKLEQWFWPAGKGKVQELDFRPGGRLVMAHESQPWRATWEYVEIVPEKRIVLHDLWDDGSGHRATGTIEFHPEAGGTRLIVTHGPFPETGPYKLEDALKGFSAGTDKLAALVEPITGPAPGAKGFTIERTFRAAPEKVWKMWTTKEGIEKWWVPSAKDMGYDMRVVGMDVRIGGKFAFELKNPEHTLLNHGVYIAVTSPSELAWMWHFDIFLGPEDTPYDVPISVRLEKTAAGGTKMTFVQGPLATPEHSEGSRQGVEANLQHLAKALGE